MMRKTIFTSLLIIASLALRAQTPPTEQRRVNETIIRLFDGIAELDFAKLKAAATPDFMLLEDGLVWNTDSLVHVLAPLKKVNFKRTNQLNFIRTEVTGNLAWVAYHNTATITINGQPRNVAWLESAVLRKEGKEWRVQLLHSTVLRPKPKR